MNLIKKLILWVRFGNVVEVVKAREAGVISEIQYIGRHGKEVGYWAYGYFNPNLPYQGE